MDTKSNNKITQNSILTYQAVSKSFENADSKVHAVNSVDLDIKKGEILALLGHSGSGKSTVLRMANRLEKPDSGKVLYKGEDISGLDAKGLRNLRKNVSMIFQSFNLFTQSTVKENLLYPLSLSKTPRKIAEERADYLLDLLGLSDKAKAYPCQLSGGQKQRVAIGRALANEAEILLSDEATSALDPKTTEEILDLLSKLREKLNLTILLVTHEMKVVEQICDRLALMDKGRIVESGDVQTIFRNPRTEIAKSFILASRSSALRLPA